jgi:mannose-6-phosphate isomerase-like protein (cupin superfamily)
MNELSRQLEQLQNNAAIEKVAIVGEVVKAVKNAGYTIVDLNDTKPWGAYVRMDGAQAGRFVADFFPGLTLEEARLGMLDAELSPKLLIVAPNQRLSWQFHDRRAERWTFFTEGAYVKSDSDKEGALIIAQPGMVVQFQKGERHRLVGVADKYAIVAEIWQHSDPKNPSNEDDIVRLADDYQR